MQKVGETGQAHQLVMPYQTVIPENIHTSNTIWTEQAAFRNICVYTCMHERVINKRIGYKFERQQRGKYGKGLEGGKEKGK